MRRSSTVEVQVPQAGAEVTWTSPPVARRSGGSGMETQHPDVLGSIPV